MMTLEEAIKWLREAEILDLASGNTKDREAVNMAISALEKQIPKKPNKIRSKNSENLWNLYCPSCDNWIGMWYSRLKREDMHNISNGSICPYCGQVIGRVSDDE